MSALHLVELATLLRARVHLTMDVDVPAASHELGGLRVRQFHRAVRVRDEHGHSGVLARLGWSVEMGRSRA